MLSTFENSRPWDVVFISRVDGRAYHARTLPTSEAAYEVLDRYRDRHPEITWDVARATDDSAIRFWAVRFALPFGLLMLLLTSSPMAALTAMVGLVLVGLGWARRIYSRRRGR